MEGRESKKKSEIMYMFNWFILQYSRNECNIVKQLYSNKKLNIYIYICNTEICSFFHSSEYISSASQQRWCKLIPFIATPKTISMPIYLFSTK